jgi:nicotinate-nucleotide--dimethylbenzimidazole phosphoribosyltransferase
MTFELPFESGRLRSPRSLNQSFLHERYSQLTMPAGALDALMHPVLKIHSQRITDDASPLRFGFVLFAGDHSVAREHGVSAYPPEVTPQMVANIVSGGAAISQLAKQRQSPLLVCDVGVAAGFDAILSVQPVEGVIYRRENLNQRFPNQGYEQGARDITRMSALTEEAHAYCWNAGVQCVDELLNKYHCDVVALGEMGIGNTTAAAAVAMAVTGLPVEKCTGRGTGIDADALQRKQKVIATAVTRCSGDLQALVPESLPWAHRVLQHLGGAELSALAGAAWRASERGVLVLLDGVIVTAAVAPFALSEKNFAEWLLASHESAEGVHKTLLEKMGLSPLLSLGLRLGEGSGAALAAGLLQDADVLIRKMATFASAGVSSS